VQLPQLTEAPAPEDAAPADVDNPGGDPARPPNQGGRPQAGNDGNTGGDDDPTTTTTTPPTTTTTTTTTSSAPPPIDPGNGAGAPAEGQAGNEGNAPQMPVEEASNGDAEDAGAG
jgi:molecular chaperone DnaK